MRRPTKRRPHLVLPAEQLVMRARQDLESHGSVRVPAAPWKTEANWVLATAQRCGWERDTTVSQMVERWLEREGWTWRWEGDDLVMELPGWVPPAPRIVAIQPGLFG